MRVEVRDRWLPHLRGAVTFVTAMALAHVLVLVGEWLVGGGAIDLGAVGGLAAISLDYVVTLCLPLLGAHLVYLALTGVPRGHALALLLVAAATIPQARFQGAFLTSGEWISRHRHVWLIELAITLVVAASLLGTWLLHRKVVLGRARGRWSALAAASAMAGLWLATGRLDAYAPTALLVSSASTVLLGSAFFAWIRTVPVPATLAALAVLVGLRFAGDPPRLVATGRLASYSSFAVAGPSADVNARLEFAGLDPSTCTTPARAPAPSIWPHPPRHVVIISIDALRRDAVWAAPEQRPVAPALTAFAAASRRFTRAITPYPSTLFALGAATTGLMPSELALAPALPQNLFSRTTAVLPHQAIILPSDSWFSLPIIDDLLVGPANRIDRPPDATAIASALVDEVRAARASGKRSFVWAHFLDPHSPYRIHPDHDFGRGPWNAYLSEVAHLDETLGSVFSAFERDGVFEDTLVIVLSDHGEALGERNYLGHHVYLNGWLLDVPLFVRGPGVEVGIDDRLVSLVDVAPTVLHALGLPSASLHGRSLLASAPPDRALVSEAFPLRGEALFRSLDAPPASTGELIARAQRLQTAEHLSYEPKVSLTTATHRLIVSRRTGTLILYDLVSDPQETTNLAHSQHAVLQRLLDELGRWHEETSRAIYCRAFASPPTP